MRRPLQSTVRILAALLSLAVAMALPAAATAGGEPGPLERRQRELTRLLELARGDAFYLVLDIEAGHLDLMLRGVRLRRFAVRSVEVGAPRIAFVPRAVTETRYDRAWTAGRLDPPRSAERLEIVAGDDPAAPPIPPPPDERFVVPRRYFVRFDEGLALEVCDAEARSRGRLGSWWRDLGDVLPLPGGRSSLRLRLTLPSEDAADLYRALPPDVRFAFDLKPQEGS